MSAGDSNKKAGSVALAVYWDQPARPLMSLVFVIPMLLCYEAGTIYLGPDAVRNGADIWLRYWLDRMGFSQHLLLPGLTCGLLLAWHHTRRQDWEFSWSVYFGMMIESIGFGSLILLMAELQGALLAGHWAAAGLTTSLGKPLVGTLICYFGAGIYEELLFRMMLLPAVVALFQLAGVKAWASWLTAIVMTSLIFAAVHYRLDLTIAGYPIHIAHGEVFDWFSFVFRFLAGFVFSLLFLFRGFGIAAGSHALYDVLAVAL